MGELIVMDELASICLATLGSATCMRRADHAGHHTAIGPTGQISWDSTTPGGPTDG